VSLYASNESMIADVVIVGGGTSGCVLAARLSEGGNRSVLLIEAGHDCGPLESLPATLRYVRHPRDDQYFWSFQVELLKNGRRQMRQVRGKVLGGSSAVNGATFVRGLAHDYNSWGVPGWGYDDVLPYFRRLETDLDFSNEYHGAGGPLPVSRPQESEWSPFAQAIATSMSSLGFERKPDLNHPFDDGWGPMPSTSRDGERISTAVAYIDPARRRSKLSIVCDAQVDEIVFTGRRAVGVRGSVRGSKFEASANEIVLSCGAFNTPNLLCASGVGPASVVQGLGREVVIDLPGVGRNLRCHPGIRISYVPKRPRLNNAHRPAHDVGLSYTSGDSASVGDMFLLARHIEDSVGLNLTVRNPVSAGFLDFAGTPAEGIRHTPRYGYLDPEDSARLVEGLRLVNDLLATRSLAWAVPADAETVGLSYKPAKAAESWLRANLYSPSHGCGTCKMGSPNDAMAVVDENCRVIGVDGLRVVDGSIMPTSVTGGPYAATVMIGERAADLF
jgi:choline dehydrogenase